ncbi:Villin headpiece, partial [Baffinella frigidus]
EKPYPEGVDPAKREVYLSDLDFQTAFGLTKAQFGGKAQWQRESAKRKLKLF